MYSNCQFRPSDVSSATNRAINERMTGAVIASSASCNEVAVVVEKQEKNDRVTDDDDARGEMLAQGL